jgi:hypothetical protein
MIHRDGRFSMRMKKLIVTLGAASLVAVAAVPASASPAASAVSVSAASASADCVPVARERRDASGLIWYEYEYVCF